MSSRSLYNRFRPKRFEDFVGNKSTVKSLKYTLESENIPNLFLFHGQAGCGKTTLARMVPKYLEISPMDVKELNIGSIRGIDNVRAVQDQSCIKPIASKYKVYILDEFHAATKEAKTAALKWMEDTPDHVIIIIATTEPHNLPKTVLSRAVQFSVKPLDSEDLKTVISRITKKLKVEISPKVIKKIVSDSDGGVRQAISFLEVVVGLDEEEALEAISPLSESSEELRSLFNCLLSPQTTWQQYASVIKGLKEEPETIRRSIIGYFSSIMLNDSKGNRSKLDRLANILEVFENNWYDGGRASLVKCCYGIFIL